MHDARPKTIQIFLPDGNARGVRIAEITSRTVQAVQIPRKKLDDAAKREEIQRVGVYFLFGDVGDDASKPPAYVGEAENCYRRIVNHLQRKGFWTTAVTIASKTQCSRSFSDTQSATGTRQFHEHRIIDSPAYLAPPQWTAGATVDGLPHGSSGKLAGGLRWDQPHILHRHLRLACGDGHE